jgi:prepilin-type N-terminal cleavage/methylation domain-containing protein
MNKSLNKIKYLCGFTLIELMIVVSVIGVLSGITISILDQGKQKYKAQDAVNLSSLEKAITAIEAYYYSEGDYPVIVAGDNGNPRNNISNTVLKDTYLQTWPEGFIYICNPFCGPPVSQYAVYVQRKASTTIYKYSSFSNEIQECIGTDTANKTDVDKCSQ